MNQEAAINAVVTVINTNKATLVTGLTIGGAARAIKWISDTPLAVPPEYYAVIVDCANLTEYPMPRQHNIADPNNSIMYVDYEIAVAVADYAVFEQGEAIYGGKAQQNFRKLVDRMVKLFLYDTKFFPLLGAVPRFCIPRIGDGPRMQVENLVPDVSNNGEYFLSSVIRFTLRDTNSNPALLYV
jgi:hypothetical protein